MDIIEKELYVTTACSAARKAKLSGPLKQAG
jgi:hypothetical protein